MYHSILILLYCAAAHACSDLISLQPSDRSADVDRLVRTLCNGGNITLSPGSYKEFCNISKPAIIKTNGRASVECLFSVSTSSVHIENVDFTNGVQVMGASVPSTHILRMCTARDLSISLPSITMIVENASAINMNLFYSDCNRAGCARLGIELFESNVGNIACNWSGLMFTWSFVSSTSASQIFIQTGISDLAEFVWSSSNITNGDVRVQHKDCGATSLRLIGLMIFNTTVHINGAARKFSLDVQDSQFYGLRSSVQRISSSFLRVEYPPATLPVTYYNNISVLRCSFSDAGNSSLRAGGKTRNGGVALLVRHSALSEQAARDLVYEEITVSDCSFTNLETFSEGGSVAIYSYSGNNSTYSLKFQRCIFSNTIASNRGGAIAAWAQLSNSSQFSLVITDCEFNSCKGAYGGAVYLEVNRENYTPVTGNVYSIIVANSNFSSIAAGSSGVLAGAILMVTGEYNFGAEYSHAGFQTINNANVSIIISRVSLRDCNGTNGPALALGANHFVGGVYTVQYSNIYFDGTRGVSVGAAYFALLQQNVLVDLSITFTKCYFTRCRLGNSAELSGGVVRAELSYCPMGLCSLKLSVLDSVFLDNSSPGTMGGALQLAVGNVNASEVLVNWGNNSVAGMDCLRGQFVGVKTESTRQTNVTLVVSRMTWTSGGKSLLAAYLMGEDSFDSIFTLLLSDSTIRDQRVQGDGSVVEVSGTNVWMNIRTSNCIFTNNSVSRTTSKLGNGGIMAFGMTKASGRVLYDNCTFSNNSATGYGGIHYQYTISGALDVLFANCSIKNSTAATGGAIALIGPEKSNHTWLISQCQFRDNGALEVGGKGGGAVYSTAPTLLVSRSLFERNRSPTDGGAIVSSKFRANDSIFFNNHASDLGGALVVTGIGDILGNVTFANNTAEVGGAIWGQTVNLRGEETRKVYIEYNRARSSSGGLNALVSEVYYAVFTGNSAGVAGAARIGQWLYSSDSVYDSNTAEVSGGAIGAEGVVHGIHRCSLSNNRASFGGAISSVQYFWVSESNFTDNLAYDNGGAIHSTSEMHMLRCLFSRNAANVGGGAVRNSKVLNIAGCTFEGNGKGALIGGALFVNEIRINDTKFQQNDASSGGAISCDGYMVLRNVSFTSNQALQDGGAISVRNNTNFFLVNFTNNTGNRGGGVFFRDGDSHVGVLTNCDSNTAVYGGCYYNSIGGRSLMNFSSGLYTGNTADFGGVVHGSASLLVYDGLFIENRAKSGGTLMLQLADSQSITPASWRVLSCSFVKNSATEGAGSAVLQLGGTPNNQSDILISRISCNASFAGGGASCVSVATGTLSIEESVFAWNSGFSGGAVESRAATTMLRKNSYMWNRARAGGGAIFSTSSALSLEGEFCTGGTAAFGGCLAYQEAGVNSSIDIWGLISTNNTAGEGGSISIACAIGMCRVNISSSMENKNTGVLGGCVVLTNTIASISKSTFTQCTANGTQNCAKGLFERNANSELCGVGSAIFQTGGTLVLAETNVSNNVAVLGSVALIGLSMIRIKDTSVVNNFASFLGGGLYLVAGQVGKPNASIEKSSVSNNSAKNGGGIHLGYTFDIVRQSLSNSTVRNNNADYGSDWSSQIVFTNVTITYTLGSLIRTALQITYGPDNQTGTISGSGRGSIPTGTPFTIHMSFSDLYGVPMKFVLMKGMAGPKVTLSSINQLVGQIRDIDVDEKDRVCFVDSTGLCTFKPITVRASLGTMLDLTLQSTSIERNLQLNISLTTCPQGFGFLAQGPSCQPCETSKYSIGGNLSCFDCTPGILCENGVASSQEGYWLAKPDPEGKLKAFRCPTDVCVMGSKCSRGHDPDSLLCGGCLPGTYIWGIGCNPCKGSSALLFVYIILFLLFINVYAVFITRTARPSETASLKIALSYSQIASLLLPDTLTGLGEALDEASGIASGSPTNIPFSTCFQPINPSFQFHLPALFNASVLLTLVLQRSVVHFLRWKKMVVTVSDRRDVGWRTTKNTLISLLFLATFSTTNSMFRFLTCESAGWDRTVIQSQPAIECKTPEWKQHLVYLILYSCVAWVLWGAMIAIIVKEYNRDMKTACVNWPFMFHNFKMMESSPVPGYWFNKFRRWRVSLTRWWQAALLLRRIMLLMAAVTAKWVKVDTGTVISAILALSLYVQLTIRPYKKKFDDLFDSAGLLLLLLAATYSDVSDFRMKLAAFICLSIGWGVLVVYTVTMWIKYIYRFIASRLRKKGGYTNVATAKVPDSKRESTAGIELLSDRSDTWGQNEKSLDYPDEYLPALPLRERSADLPTMYYPD